ncbi:MAG: hypothetical protein V7742_03560 [Halioglobus sp.]
MRVCTKMVLLWATVELHQPEEHTNDTVNARLTAANVMAAMKFVVKYFSEISTKSKPALRRLHPSSLAETGNLQVEIYALGDQAENGIFPYCRR